MIVVHAPYDESKRVFVICKTLLTEDFKSYVTVVCEWMTRYKRSEGSWFFVAKDGTRFIGLVPYS